MTLTIVSHNAYWFQGAPSLWGEERSAPQARVVEALLGRYAELAPDVLCLQEVPGADVVESLRATLGMDGAYLCGGLRPEYGGAVLWRGATGTVRELTHEPVATPGGVFERMAAVLDAAVNGRRVAIANAHLSSNRFAPNRDGEPVRLAELATLLAACPEAAIVVGDLNARAGSEPPARMRALGFIDACAPAVDDDLAQRRVDYIWTRPTRGITIADCQVLAVDDLRLTDDDRVRLSDHPVLCADLEVEPL